MTCLTTHAGLVLRQQRVSLADVYSASAALVPPALIHLAGGDDAARRALRKTLATEQASTFGLAAVLRREAAFHKAAVDAFDSPTLAVLNDMLLEIIDRAASRLDGQSASTVRHLAAPHIHHDIAALVEAGRGQAAASRAQARASDIEKLIRQHDTAGGRFGHPESDAADG